MIVTFALALLLAPLAVLAAPYADYVIDVRTGEVLHEENANTRLHPASLTKMMTLYIAFEAIERGEISLDSKVTISRHAASMPPSKLGLKPGQTIALRYLIRAAAIKSANDAATAIGEAIEGSEPAFAKRMNRTAKALGMTRTTFANANGLTAKGHLSTAHDMTVLGRHLFYDYPQYYNIFSRTSADAGVAQVASTNRRFLAAYEGADGIKTGYTTAAGFNLVASAHRGNKHVIATVFGGKSTADRNARAAQLLDMGFGKAPNRVAVQKPARPAYSGTDYADAGEAAAVGEPETDEMAEAIARAVTTAPDAVAAGKTIRLNVAIVQSPRPRARPLPGPAEPESAPAEELLLAMQDDIASALAEAQSLSLDEAAADAAVADGEDAGEAAIAVADAVPAADAATAGPAFAQTTIPQPETALALAGPAAEALPGAAVPLAPASAIAPEASVKPVAAPRPANAPDAPIAAEEAPVAAVEVEVAAVDPAAPLLTPIPETVPELEAADLTDAGNAAEAAETAAVQPAAAGTPEPKARPEQIVLATYTAAEPAPEELEVVTRVSTSGGRQWAVNVGHFGSRYDAERQLLQTALVEMSTLDEALRKVVSRRGGYDANFVGMTEEMATLACRRLQARQAECSVIGP
ncbi:serine hydrolase [Albidovulum sp.]|uniref:serine hydrolase n=1 Tax=Albidovulum sp. TaxID=1872424 RepID=UPI0039B9C681